MEKEKLDSASSGYMGLLILLAFLVGGILMLVMFNQQLIGVIAGPVFLVTAVFLSLGFVVVNPNESSVLTLFG